MLTIYSVTVDMVRSLKPLMETIRKLDPDLEKQLRRAAASVVLNIAEGEGSRGGTARARFETASGSTKEVRACLHTAEALGYVERVDATTMDRIDRVAATLHKLSR